MQDISRLLLLLVITSQLLFFALPLIDAGAAVPHLVCHHLTHSSSSSWNGQSKTQNRKAEREGMDGIGWIRYEPIRVWNGDGRSSSQF
ncbi:hypothetical protein QBC47DRAFT_391232 [Echria macrotheca]|uniref:Secreted protein n=1 Tax=Echria macrotheca TaxID=438768 RepID=A0AAJ0B5F2_9PEZI|nr:hypothetical protein QBC47DRAFT_391232 [Echria macrotheca]